MEDILEFFKTVTGYDPYEYQEKFLKSDTKRIAFRSGRQIGKTTMCAVKALYKAYTYTSQEILILAPVQRQASLMFWQIKQFIAQNEDIKECVIRETMTQIYFENGSRLHCIPGGHTGAGIRGFSPNLIIVDEAAWLPEEVFVAIEPSLAVTDGDMVLVSTPYGKRGFFFESFSDDEYDTYHVRSSECPRITEKFLKSKKNRMTKNDYLQEYEGEFIAESDVMFPIELIKELATAKEQGHIMGHYYDLGVDCARMGGDETVLMVCNKTLREICYIEPMPKGETTYIMDRIRDLHSAWKFEYINVDSSNMGGPITDVLISEGLPVRRVNFGSIRVKGDAYKHLKLLMEQRAITFPNNKNLIYQMRGLVIKLIFQGLKIQPIDRRHDDYPDSLAIAVINLMGTEGFEEEAYFVSS